MILRRTWLDCAHTRGCPLTWCGLEGSYLGSDSFPVLIRHPLIATFDEFSGG
jgi:hypothetical protein